MEADQVANILLDVQGMWCTSCANAVERVLNRQPGVLGAKVSFPSESATLEWDCSVTSLATILGPVKKLGYECVPEGPSQDRAAHFARLRRDLSLRLVVAAFLSMWVMTAQWTLYLEPDEGLTTSVRFGFALFAGLMCAPVVGYCAAPFFRAALRTLRAGAPGMDFLVSLGASASFALSLWRLSEGSSSVYFDSSAMIVTFLLAGRLLEMSVRGASSDAVKSLLELPPETAQIVTENGTEATVLAKRVTRDDVIRIRPGERLPLDGVVIAGTSSLDRSLLTGETEFRTVGVDDSVEAGALNGEGEILVRVVKVWGERRVDLIARTVRLMLSRKTASQALAERLARYLTPTICAIALLALAIARVRGDPWGASVEHAVSVLVVTCPCALGIAVPLALNAGVGRAARCGILFRDVEALESAGRIRSFFLDKTGTLTEGKPALIGARLVEGFSERELLLNAALAERGSEHPLAKAIIESLTPSERATVEQQKGYARAVPGAGIVWHGDDGTHILAGTEKFLSECGADVLVDASRHTVVHVARNGRWIGSMEFADTPRSGAAEALKRLTRSGVEFAILTGDKLEVAQDTVRMMGLSDIAIYAGRSPEEKAYQVVAAQSGNRKVGFVGDGLNDSAALAAADFGVAVRGSTASSTAVAAVVLVDGGIERIDFALNSARRVAGAIRQNLAAAVVYNLLAIPLAFSGWISPALAAALMVASSLSVTLNSSRLAFGKTGSLHCTKGIFRSKLAPQSDRLGIQSTI
ncbi:heavy metal translocating P-type ATPase [Paraburkholderia pallida]|uniref:Cation-translocating P-type ATPase n=1 Tax=Paraburkholderia pallida TaxID=2547399 RepID=A0A4P7D4L2_9BURK|nr:cation-translocating P-type ATPase [Paraburkholderia pallida]QBR03731.1 cation-translocating P-type ATPase [Paraburkholderia pallida]